MKSSSHFFYDHLGMPTQFTNSLSPVSVLHGINLWSTNILPTNELSVILGISLCSRGTDHTENTTSCIVEEACLTRRCLAIGTDHIENTYTVAWRGPHRKRRYIVACRNVFTESLPSNALRCKYFSGFFNDSIGSFEWYSEWTGNYFISKRLWFNRVTVPAFAWKY